MREAEGGLAPESRDMAVALLIAYRAVPQYTLFRDDFFNDACGAAQYGNRVGIIRDVTPSIVPSAEILTIRAAP